MDWFGFEQHERAKAMADAHIHAASVWERSSVVSYGAPSTLVRRNQVRFDCVFFRWIALNKQISFFSHRCCCSLSLSLSLSLCRGLCLSFDLRVVDSPARCVAQNSWQARMLRKTRKYSLSLLTMVACVHGDW